MKTERELRIESEFKKRRLFLNLSIGKIHIKRWDLLKEAGYNSPEDYFKIHDPSQKLKQVITQLVNEIYTFENVVYDTLARKNAAMTAPGRYNPEAQPALNKRDNFDTTNGVLTLTRELETEYYEADNDGNYKVTITGNITVSDLIGNLLSSPDWPVLRIANWLMSRVGPRWPATRVATWLRYNGKQNWSNRQAAKWLHDEAGHTMEQVIVWLYSEDGEHTVERVKAWMNEVGYPNQS